MSIYKKNVNESKYKAILGFVLNQFRVHKGDQIEEEVIPAWEDVTQIRIFLSLCTYYYKKKPSCQRFFTLLQTITTFIFFINLKGSQMSGLLFSYFFPRKIKRWYEKWNFTGQWANVWRLASKFFGDKEEILSSLYCTSQ